MKVLKVIGIIVLILIAVIIVLGLVAPKKYNVERSVVIDAPKELVFEHVKYWRNWQKWSPWAAQDPTMEVFIEGKDGEMGSIYKWTGDPDKTGVGQMTNTGIKDNEEIAYHLNFMKPWESESDGYVRLSEVDGGTKVAWGFYGENPFPWNIVMLFMSMDKMVGKEFDTGLGLLKNLAEKEAKMVAGFKIKQVKFSAKSYAAIRKEISFKDMQSFFQQSYETIQRAMRKKYLRPRGAPSGLYYTWDEQNMKSDMAAAMPIRGKINVGEVKTIKLPKTTAFSIDYYGSYEGSIYAHKALGLYMQQNGLTLKAPVVEEYITNPQAEPDTSKWLTKIYYFAE